MNFLVEKALAYSKDILNRVDNYPLSWLELKEKISTNQGVYIIKHNSDGVIYVGKGKNLKRRLISCHLSGEKKVSTSSFRRKVIIFYGLTAGKPLLNWIEKNTKVAFIEIENSDICHLTEALLIAKLRSKKLLNSA